MSDNRPQVNAAGANCDPSRCSVLVPAGSAIEPACERGLRELERRGYPVWRVYGFSAIDQGRNQMATDALVQGFEETMWIDSDTEFHPDDVERLRAHNLPLCCALYPKKGKRELASHVLPGTEKLVFGTEGGLAEILYAGTGFLHVRRQTYETIHRELDLPVCNERWHSPMIPFFMPLVVPEGPGHWYLTEDFAFSERARQCGFKIMADTTIRLKHIGKYGYTWEDAGLDPPRYATFHYHLSGGAARHEPAAATDSAQRAYRFTSRGAIALAEAFPWPEQRPRLLPDRTAGRLREPARQMLAGHLSDKTQVVIELGSWLGLATRFLAQQSPRAAVVAIDLWRGGPEQPNDPAQPRSADSLYELFLASCWDYRDQIIPLRQESVEGLRTLAEFNLRPDLIYVNAGHEYGPLRHDLEAALDSFPGVRIVGDGWDLPGVRQAVDELALDRGRRVNVDQVAWTI